MQMSLDRSSAHAEDKRNFCFWQVDDVAQHDDLLLPPGERPHGADDVVPLDDVLRGVPGDDGGEKSLLAAHLIERSVRSPL